ncbi:MAG: cytochrome c-type biogenesis CcmF C-terminal domain-containing protein [Flavobacteriales bacterium]
MDNAHVMILTKKKKNLLYTAYFLTLSSFILVLYSTFLTRSGILGDSSVHSFTSDGMLGQLLLYLLFFIALSVFMMLLEKKDKKVYGALFFILSLTAFIFEIYVICIVLFLIFSAYFLFRSYSKYFMSQDEDERFWSKEFWMFLGALVLLLSAVQITASTSIPVYNELLKPFGPLFTSLYDATGIEFFTSLAKADFAPPSEPRSHYNSWQVPIATIITLLAGAGQYLRYKKTDHKQFLKKISNSLIISLIISAFSFYIFEFKELYDQNPQRAIGIIALLFSSAFTVVANFNYWVSVLKGKFNHAGASIAHIGFGMIIFGALVSQAKQTVISKNTSGLNVKQLSEDFKNNNDLLLIKDDTLQMGNYFVSYSKKYRERNRVKFKMNYFDSEPRYYQKNDTVNLCVHQKT